MGIRPFKPGSLAPNAKTREALGDFLGRLGQLLEIDMLGEAEYYYGITHVADCLDRDTSEGLPGGFVKKPAFEASSIPSQGSTSKEANHPSSVYANDAANAALDQRIAESGITGMGFTRA